VHDISVQGEYGCRSNDCRVVRSLVDNGRVGQRTSGEYRSHRDEYDDHDDDDDHHDSADAQPGQSLHQSSDGALPKGTRGIDHRRRL
jgi:hypothetical protein